MKTGKVYLTLPGTSHCRLNIHTLEGVMVADPGDYIIKGIQGEIYPCKPDIFAATYEPADAADHRPRTRRAHVGRIPDQHSR